MLVLKTKICKLIFIAILATTSSINAKTNLDTSSITSTNNNNTDINSKIYFMPNDGKNALSDIIKSIKNAKNNIKIAMYSFRHKQIAKALKQASKNGIKVYVIFDDKVLHKGYKSRYKYLKKQKSNMYVYTLKGLHNKNNKSKKKLWGKMHSKYMIIDNRKLFFGSLNFKPSSFNFNYEVLYATNEAKLVGKFLSNFNAILIARASFNTKSHI
jgi:phosphatidylserine/phosphatidylglycerophosphate/cardiolipin synthase-like enzyme